MKRKRSASIYRNPILCFLGISSEIPRDIPRISFSVGMSVRIPLFSCSERVYDHERVIRDLSVRVTNLSVSKSRLDEAIGSNDIKHILAAIQDMEHHLAIEYVSSRRNDCSFPTELTSLLLQRFGGQASVWVGRYLRVYQMKTLKYQVNPHDVSKFGYLSLVKTN
ncbi:unnamed protein product [Brassica oleracea var. botrytis]